MRACAYVCTCPPTGGMQTVDVGWSTGAYTGPFSHTPLPAPREPLFVRGHIGGLSLGVNNLEVGRAVIPSFLMASREVA